MVPIVITDVTLQVKFHNYCPFFPLNHYLSYQSTASLFVPINCFPLLTNQLLPSSYQPTASLFLPTNCFPLLTNYPLSPCPFAEECFPSRRGISPFLTSHCPLSPAHRKQTHPVGSPYGSLPTGGGGRRCNSRPSVQVRTLTRGATETVPQKKETRGKKVYILGRWG